MIGVDRSDRSGSEVIGEDRRGSEVIGGWIGGYRSDRSDRSGSEIRG